jgi:pimeloyl-ACP methyl ester carboxylesterase
MTTRVDDGARSGGSGEPGAALGGERIARVGRDIELCYRIDGRPDGPPLILIAGLGQQLNEWSPELVEGLIDEGFRVVRFDNRDVGRSSRVPIAPPSSLSVLVQRGFRGEQYTLDDMALDTIGLLDRLGFEAAHLVGMSMGGMIGQLVAARYPARILTLTSIMSNTGARRVGRPRLSTYLRLYAPPKTTREEYADQCVAMMRHIGCRGFPFDAGRARATALEAFDRGGGANSDGVARQLAAIWKSRDRTRELARITAPTLVIHGNRDPMVAPSGGRATARAIPGARLVTIRGMGHDLPAGACPQLVQAIVDHARQVQPTVPSLPERQGALK